MWPAAHAAKVAARVDRGPRNRQCLDVSRYVRIPRENALRRDVHGRKARPRHETEMTECPAYQDGVPALEHGMNDRLGGRIPAGRVSHGIDRGQMASRDRAHALETPSHVELPPA